MNRKHSKTKEYFDTTLLDSEIIDSYTGKAKKQDQIILDVFKYMKEISFTSHEIEAILENRYPRSSIVRSINTLCKRGYIFNTGIKVIGEYGRPVFTYKYNA